MPEDFQSKFRRTKVYLKGIAEEEPIEILYTSKLTRIPPSSKTPLNKFRWHEERSKWKLKDLNELHDAMSLPLDFEPVDADELIVSMIHFRNRVEHDHDITADSEYELDAGRPVVMIPKRVLLKEVKGSGLTPEDSITIEIRYPRP